MLSRLLTAAVVVFFVLLGAETLFNFHTPKGCYKHRRIDPSACRCTVCQSITLR